MSVGLPGPPLPPPVGITNQIDVNIGERGRNRTFNLLIKSVARATSAG